MAEKRLQYFSLQEYLELEANALEKHEYDDGVIVAMSGGTLNHGIISNNINTALNNALNSQDAGCISINGDVKIYLEQANAVVYPDGMVICGPVETSGQDKNAVTNPVLIVEVLSKSTESYDRGEKFHKYCSLPSFKEYILIDQQKPVIDTLFRDTASYWKMVTTIGMEKSLYIHTLDCHIPLAGIYRNAQNLSAPPFYMG